MKHTLTINVGIAIAFMFCIMGVLSLDAKADEPKPTQEDYANLEDIKSNQNIIEETREAHERHLQAKAWNQAEVSALASNGWCPKWSEDSDDITLEPCSFQ